MVTLKNIVFGLFWPFFATSVFGVAILWQKSVAKLGIKPTKPGSKPLFKEARLSDGGGDLKKQWVVEFGVWSEQAEKVIRKRIRLSEPTVAARRKTAEALIKHINKQLKQGLVTDIIPELKNFKKAVSSPGAISVTAQSSVDDALSFFLKFKGATIKKASKKTYTSAGNVFWDFLVVRDLRKLKLIHFTADFATAYQDYLILERKAKTPTGRLTNKSLNKHFGFCQNLFGFYVSRKILTENPFEHIQMLATRSTRHIPFLPAQVEEIKNHLTSEANNQLWLFINFIYFTLSRPHEELRMLRVRDIQSKTVLIQSDSTKNSQNNGKLIAPPLEELIQQHRIRQFPPHFFVFGKGGTPNLEPYGESYFYVKHRAMLQALGLPHTEYDLYGWKHTGAIALYQHTKDLKFIQRMCGHADITTTDQYIRDLGLFLDDNPLAGLPPL